MTSDELYHHGILGMKWGVRRDKKTTEKYNSKYTSEQRKRDKSVYGSSSVKRINKRLNEGYSISGARSKEATNINRARNSAKVTGSIGSVVGKVGGAIGGFVASRYVISHFSDRVPALNDPQVGLIASTAISAGVSSIANTLGRQGGVAISMLAGGYSPSKFRE